MPPKKKNEKELDGERLHVAQTVFELAFELKVWYFVVVFLNSSKAPKEKSSRQE